MNAFCASLSELEPCSQYRRMILRASHRKLELKEQKSIVKLPKLWESRRESDESISFGKFGADCISGRFVRKRKQLSIYVWGAPMNGLLLVIWCESAPALASVLLGCFG
jgi:hypothetical protein